MADPEADLDELPDEAHALSSPQEGQALAQLGTELGDLHAEDAARRGPPDGRHLKLPARHGDLHGEGAPASQALHLDAGTIARGRRSTAAARRRARAIAGGGL